MLAVLWRILAAVSRSLMDLLSVCHEGWWDSADDLGSTDTGTLSEDDTLRLASLYATGAPSLVCSGSKAGTSALSCALASCSYCCDVSSRMSSSESVPGSVLSRSSALSHHPLGLNNP